MENFFLDSSNDYFKSFEKIAQLQMEAGEKLLKSQSELWSEIVDQGMAYTEIMMGQTSPDDFMKAQQTFFDGIGTRVKNITEESIGVITETNEKMAAMFNVPTMSTSASSATPKATKPTPAAKPKPAAVKASSKTKKKPAAKRTSTKAKSTTDTTAAEPKPTSADS